MAETYGLPYTGSKSRIAHWVIDNIEDDRFEIVAEKQKITSMASVKSSIVTERLYTVHHYGAPTKVREEKKRWK